MLKHLETVFTAGAVGSLPDGLILERFLAGRGNAELFDRPSDASWSGTGRWCWACVMTPCAITRMPRTRPRTMFLTLAKQGRSILCVESLASWLYGVGQAAGFREAAKVEAARRRVVERRGAEMNAQMQSSEREELSTWLHEELCCLPEKYRSPIVLCHLEGLSNEHAALQLLACLVSRSIPAQAGAGPRAAQAAAHSPGRRAGDWLARRRSRSCSMARRGRR